MSTVTVGKPTPSNRFEKVDHLGHLVAFIDPHVEETETAFGATDAAACGVICVNCQLGWPDQLIFGKALVPRLAGSIDPVVAGLLVQGDSKPGREPPWLLDEPNDAELADVQALVDDVVTRLASGKLVVDYDSLRGEAKF